MASIAFPDISHKVQLPSGTTYGFAHVKPSGDKPHILLLHGFPSSAYDWRHQIHFLAKEGYGVIAPDLLGYGDTDKPTDLQPYKLKSVAADIANLLDALNVKTVIGVSHDWSVRHLLDSMGRFLRIKWQGIWPFVQASKLPPRTLCRSFRSSFHPSQMFLELSLQRHVL